MKKSILFSAVAVAALSLASCKKDRTCSCSSSTTSVRTVTDNKGVVVSSETQTDATPDTYVTKLGKLKKTQAVMNCSPSNESVSTYTYTSSIPPTYTASGTFKTVSTNATTCELK